MKDRQYTSMDSIYTTVMERLKIELGIYKIRKGNKYIMPSKYGGVLSRSSYENIPCGMPITSEIS